MKSLRFTSILIFVGLLVACSSSKVPPIIDREKFFDDPFVARGRLSPDGQYLSFLRPYNGVRNIWIKKCDASFEEAIPLTSETLRPILNYFWSRDGKYILFILDKGGEENYNIYAIDPSEASEGMLPVTRNLTNIEGVTVEIHHMSRIDSDLLFIGLNDRDPAWHDLYSLRISTGELVRVMENTNRYTSWEFDHQDNLRLASRSHVDGSNELWRIDNDGEELLLTASIFETFSPYSFTKDNQSFYIVSNVGDSIDLMKLYLLDIETGDMKLAESDPLGRVDFGWIHISDFSLEVLYTEYNDDYPRQYFWDKEFELHFNKLKDRFKGMEISFFSSTNDERLWLVSVWSDTNPGEVYLYDMNTYEILFQYNPYPELPTEYLSPMRSIRYPSSDGLEIQAYLTLPMGLQETNLPLVVMPHGGPWVRDYWEYNSKTQFLANRGYAVLQPNFRASAGFGKEFLNAGNRQWGELMQDDITWGVKHLIEEGIVDRSRVGIYGDSYGGYAVLAGLAFTPELYACGVSFVGPSNLITLLNSIPPYWESIREAHYERMGNPNTEEGIERMKRQSPLFSARQISAPLMVVQGENDPRVNKHESDQIVVALRERGFPVEYINAPNEGHGFAHPVNNMAFIAAMERFLAKHLGGRYQESISDEVAQRLKEITVDVSTVELPTE